MLKQTLEQKIETAERVGAGVLAGIAMLVSVEMVLEHAPGHEQAGHAVAGSHSNVLETLARGEGKGETARLPEEFDIGLQSPSIAGV